MGRTAMSAVVSLDGYIADDDDGVGPLFDWFGNGDVEWTLGDAARPFRSAQASVGPGPGAVGPGEEVLLEGPSRTVQAKRVTHVVYDVHRP